MKNYFRNDVEVFYNDYKNDIEYRFEANVSEFFPAKLYGKPEDCYEAEGGEIEELDIYKLNDDGSDGEIILETDFIQKYGSKEFAKVCEQLQNAAAIQQEKG